MEIIGFVAAFCTTISFLPQVIRTIKTKNTYGISLGMYSVFVLGVGLWLIYGLMINDLPMTLANSVTLVLASFILSLKVKDVIADKRKKNQSFSK
jgi:MtN3 and saliva related transmembrane protein